MSLKGFPPKLFLIGALRTGSTFLASLLNKHPEICVSNPKEPGYFTGRWSEGAKWYRNQFATPDESVLVDATAWYSAGPTAGFPKTARDSNSQYEGVPKRIRSFSTDARFIYIVRDPIERIRSLYWFMYRTSNEQQTFSHAIRNNSLYLRTSDYHGQLDHFLQYFSPDRFKIVSFEHLITAPASVAKRCFQFLELRPFTVNTDVQPHERNASYQYRLLIHLLSKAFGSEAAERVYRNIVKLSPESLSSFWETALFKPKPALGHADHQYLSARLSDVYSNESLPIDGYELVRLVESTVLD